jgi:hypothetical protein
MRIDDASSLSTQVVLPVIEPGVLSVLQIEPEDTLEAVLALLAHVERPIIIVLPERGPVFSQAEDFTRLKQCTAPTIVSFVLPRDRMSSVATFAYDAGFPFTSSIEKAEASFLQQREDIQEQATPVSETAYGPGEDEPFSWSSSGYHPVLPLPETRPPRKQRSRKFLVLVVTSLFLAIISVTLLPILFAQPSSSPLIIQPHQSAPTDANVGQLRFTSSGQLDPNSRTGLNDVVSLTLDSVIPPPVGMSLYAWLLSDKTQDSRAPILLGKLQIVSGKAQISYQNPHHTDLLVTYSRVLITAQDSTTTPTSPPLDTKTWKDQGSIPDIPTPGDEQGYSLLSHMRHLLAKDPTLTSLGLSGGLDIWLYRNTGKIFEWSNAARDDWGGNNTDLLRRQIDRVVEYLDGQVYAWRDLPANTPWLVDPKAGRPGLIDFTTAQDEQGPTSYVSHVRLHLTGMVNAPGHTEAQQQLASKIDTALTQVETVLKLVRKDAVQLAKMSATQLKSQHALTLLNEMQINASNVYIGQTTESVPGVVWVHDSLQQLATVPIITV